MSIQAWCKSRGNYCVVVLTCSHFIIYHKKDMLVLKVEYWSEWLNRQLIKILDIRKLGHFLDLDWHVLYVFEQMVPWYSTLWNGHTGWVFRCRVPQNVHFNLSTLYVTYTTHRCDCSCGQVLNLYKIYISSYSPVLWYLDINICTHLAYLYIKCTILCVQATHRSLSSWQPNFCNTSRGENT